MKQLIIHHPYNGKRITSEMGSGTVFSVEGKEGVLATRFAIQLDCKPKNAPLSL